MKVAAVVVTYNRVELLRACLDALQAQSRRPDEILVIDNGSTDETVTVVRAEYPSVVLCALGRNTGGAGGFAAGVDLAITRGHDAAWLMDDDAEPEHGALSPLVEVLASDKAPGFAASTVWGHDGSPLLDHVSTTSRTEVRNGHQVLKSDYATFVGVLVNLAVARRTHLPITDFFLWYDDNEYTRRLGHLAGGCYVPASRMRHPRKVRTRDIGSRVYFAVRNPIWICRQDWVRGLRRHYLRDAGSTAVAQLVFGHDRLQSLQHINRAVRDGVMKRPDRPAIGSISAGLKVQAQTTASR